MVKQFTRESKGHLKQVHEFVREQLEIASDRMKARYHIWADDFFVPHNRKSGFMTRERKESEATEEMKMAMECQEPDYLLMSFIASIKIKSRKWSIGAPWRYLNGMFKTEAGAE